MSSADKIRKLIDNAKIKTNPEVNKAVLNSLIEQMEQSEGPNMVAGQKSIWSMIMHKKMTKFAAAAVVIVGVLLGAMLLDKTVSPVYALEQSVKAMENAVWMHAVPYSTMEGAESVFGETWFSATHRISAVKREDRSAQITYFDKDESYHYDPANETITVLLASKIDVLGKSNSYAEVISNTIDTLDDHEGTEITTTSEVQDGKKVIVTELKVPKGKPGTEIWRFVIDEETSLLIRLKLDGYNEKGEFIEFADVAFDYPDSGPMDIYQLGAPKTAKIIDKRPSIDVQTIIENYQAARENDISRYTALVLYTASLDDGFEVVQEGTIYYADGNKYRNEHLSLLLAILDSQEKDRQKLIPQMEDSLESMLEWWTNRDLLRRRIAEMYDGEYKHHVTDHLKNTGSRGGNKNTKSRVRNSKPPNLQDMYTAGAAFLQDGSNDLATVKQTITLIENEYSKENDLFCLQRLEEDGRFPFMHQGRRFKRLCYIDPNRNYICVRIEEYFIQDKLWKKLFKDADRFLIKNQDASLGYTKLEVRESTELDQSKDGKWYSKRIELRTTTQLGNDELQKRNSAFMIYLDADSEIPEDIFDPDAFSIFLE